MTIVFSQNTSSFQLCLAANTEGRFHVFQGIDDWVFYPGDIVTNIPISKESQTRIKELTTAFKHIGTDVVFVLAPTRGMLHFEKMDQSQAFFNRYDRDIALRAYIESLNLLQENGFVVPNLLTYILENNENIEYGFIQDSHWSPAGASLVASAVKQATSTLASYQSLDLEEFEVQLSEILKRPGDLIEYAKRVCPNLQVPFMEEEVFEVSTKLVDSQISLFGETSVSVIPLWGTSYSNSSSFQALLQAELDATVVNYAVNGGGLWTSMLSYYLNQDILSNGPKIAIWEIPYSELHQFNDVDSYSEAIATIYGACADDQIVLPLVTYDLVATKNYNTQVSFHKDWQPKRANIEFGVGIDKNHIVKLIFSGEKDPWMTYAFEAETDLEGKEYNFSIYLWTDENQPRNAALYMYSDPDNVVMSKLLLTTEPTLYNISYRFSGAGLNSFKVRIDGIQGQWTEESQGQYLYASSPTISLNQIEIINDMDIEIQGRDYYSFIEFEDKSVVEFDLVYEYFDGNKISVSVARLNQVANNGKFFYELPSYEASPLKRMYVEGLVPDVKGSLNMQICKKIKE